MAKNLLVINCDIRETRVALIENGIIAELHLERDAQVGTLGNIYLGKVSRVLPGMQAAFIDIGQERAAFLHVEDLIRPDDFEAYLAGHRTAMGHAQDGSRPASGPTEEDAAATDAGEATPTAEAPAGGEAGPAEAPAGGRGPRRDAAPGPDAAAPAEGERRGRRRRRGRGRGGEGRDAEPTATAGESATSSEAEDGDDEAVVSGELADGGAPASFAEPDVEALVAVDVQPQDERDLPASDADSAPEVPRAAEAVRLVEVNPETDDAPAPSRRRARSRKSRSTAEVRAAEDSPAVPVEAADVSAIDPVADIQHTSTPLDPDAADPTDAVDDADPTVGEGETTVASPEDEAGARRSRRGRARTRRSGRTADRREKMAAVPVAAPHVSASRKPKVEPLRVSKSTPIREVVREGQEVIVQVSKEPIGTKGARVTSHVSLPGRYVVYLPTVEHVGISKRIGSDKERSRLRSAIDAMKPPTGGLIVRTLAEGLTKKDLKNDVGYLVRLWGEVIKKRETTNRAPECLYTELDIVLRTARDLFTDDIEKIVIDDADQYVRLKRFLEMFMPERADAVELYEGSEPIFDEYGIEEEIGRALSRKVPLDSGGHLIIDQAEALTAIDVNTGRFVGKGSTDLEDTILKTNLEAVQEIAYQLRFRNLGGLIILDLIDMEKAQNREKVRRRLEELLSKDKAKTTLNRISDLGLIEMTRKRTRESLSRTMNEACFYCDGTGNLQSKQTIGYEILRQIKREAPSLRGYVVVVAAHPAVVDLLKHEERAAVTEAERRYHRRIELVPRKDYHLEQFDLQGR
jgi:ribonuclease G